jgi:hypothetical protein
LHHIKERFSSQELKSLSHLVQRLSHVDVRVLDPRRSPFEKNITFLGDSYDSKDEAKIGLAEGTRNKKPVLCLFAKKDTEKYGFDITKANRIFDFLLWEGQIKLSPNHTIPSDEELKNHKYCKWHNAVSHNTNECKTFR